MEYHISPAHTKKRGQWIACPAGNRYCRTDGEHIQESELEYLREIHSVVSGVKNSSRARFSLAQVQATRELVRQLSTTPGDMASHVYSLHPEKIAKSKRMLQSFENKAKEVTTPIETEPAPAKDDTTAEPPARVTHVVKLEDNLEDLLAHLHNPQYTVVFPAYREANYGTNRKLAEQVLAFINSQTVVSPMHSVGRQIPMGSVRLVARSIGWFRKEWVLLAYLSKKSQLVEWATIEAHCQETLLRKKAQDGNWSESYTTKAIKETREKLERLGLKHFLNL
jgi:hypothetical protein